MRNIFSKYALLLSVAVGLSACADSNELNIAMPDHNMAQQPVDMQFAASLGESVSKSYMYLDTYDNRVSAGFSTGDFMSVFSGSSNNGFVCVDSKGVFDGTAALSEDGYYALFPYQAEASISGNVIKAKISDNIINKQSDNYSRIPDGTISVGYTSDDDMSFSLKNASAVMAIRLEASSLESIEIEANKNIAGDVSVTVNKDGIPVISGGTSNKITITNIIYCSYSMLVAVMPVSNVDITIKYNRKDGSSFTESYSNLTFSRNQVLYLGEGGLCAVKYDTQVPDYTIEDMTYGDGLSLILPALDNSKNPGYSLLGWRAPDGNIYSPAGVYTVTGDVTLVAEWTKKFVLSYNSGMYMQSVPDAVTFTDGETVTIEAGSSIFIFKGWKNEATGQIYYPGDKVAFSGSVALEPIVYRVVSLDANGGTFDNGEEFMEWALTGSYYLYPMGQWNDASSMFMGGWQDLVESRNFPTRDGYVLSGWRYIEDGQAKTVTRGELIWKPCELVAVWTKLCNVYYYNVNEENIYTQLFMDSDVSVSIGTVFLNVGGMLAGWRDQFGNTYQASQIIIPSEVFGSNPIGDLHLTPIIKDVNPSSHEGWGNIDID